MHTKHANRPTEKNAIAPEALDRMIRADADRRRMERQRELLQRLADHYNRASTVNDYR